MTSAIPCRLVRCKSKHPDQESRPHPRSQAAGHALPCFKQNANNPCLEFWHNAGKDFESRLLNHEHMAKRQYWRLLNALSLEKLPGWFDQMLNQRTFPILNRIGFDPAISKGLFAVASSAWCRLGPANDRIIPFHPKIDQEIENVRRELELTVGSVNDKSTRLPGPSSAVFSGTINESPSPEHLLALLDNIATPWIVLPRASRFLKKDQCRYLQAYLTAIAQEKRELFLILFTRITVEFVGNYSFKFAAKCHQPDQIAKLLFYAYACLFWKTLRCPPRNLESCAAFDIFFNWLNRFTGKSDYLGDAEHRSINCMKTMKNQAFPASAADQFGKLDTAQSSRFLVTLRHGYLGIAAVLKYFGFDQFSMSRQINGWFQSQSFQNDLQGLLKIIQQNQHLESNRTRGNINQFLENLRSAYMILQRNFHPTSWNFLINKINNIQVLLNN